MLNTQPPFMGVLMDKCGVTVPLSGEPNCYL